MEKKQSSVEWLEKAFYTHARSTGFDNDKWVIKEETLDKLFEKSKAIQKEQSKKDFISGMEFIPVDPNRYEEDAEQYYNETFGNETNKTIR